MAQQLVRPVPHQYASRQSRQSRQQAGASGVSAHARRVTRKGAIRARPIRFAITGIMAGLVQLALLTFLVGRGWPSLGANGAAFLLAAQLNFALSNAFTWRDRRAGRSLRRRWALFHGSIAGMAVLNMAVFAVARLVVPTLVASAAGICAAAIGNYLIGDRLVFSTRPQRPLMAQPAASATGRAA